MVALSTTIRKDTGKLKKLRRVLDRLFTPMLERTAKDGQRIAQDSIRNSPGDSGRFYRSPRTGRIQEASFPGNAPRQDSGGVIQGIKWRKVKSDEYVIESTSDASAALEFGEGNNLGGQPLAARPYMMPMVVKLRKKYPKLAKETINEPLIRKLIR